MRVPETVISVVPGDLRMASSLFWAQQIRSPDLIGLLGVALLSRPSDPSTNLSSGKAFQHLPSAVIRALNMASMKFRALTIAGFMQKKRPWR